MTQESAPEVPEGTPLVMAVSAPLKLIAKDGRERRDNAIRAVGVAPGAASYFWPVEAYCDNWSLFEREL